MASGLDPILAPGLSRFRGPMTRTTTNVLKATRLRVLLLNRETLNVLIILSIRLLIMVFGTEFRLLTAVVMNVATLTALLPTGPTPLPNKFMKTLEMLVSMVLTIKERPWTVPIGTFTRTVVLGLREAV